MPRQTIYLLHQRSHHPTPQKIPDLHLDSLLFSRLNQTTLPPQVTTAGGAVDNKIGIHHRVLCKLHLRHTQPHHHLMIQVLSRLSLFLTISQHGGAASLPPHQSQESQAGLVLKAPNDSIMAASYPLSFAP